MFEIWSMIEIEMDKEGSEMKKVLIMGLLLIVCLSGCFSEGRLKPGIHGTSAGKEMEKFLESRPDKNLSNPSLSDYQIKTSQNFYFYNFIKYNFKNT